MKLSKIWTNNKMKSRRSVSIIAAAALMAGVFCGCVNTADSTQMTDIANETVANAESVSDVADFVEDKKSIVCTTFPQYDWVREMLGEKAQDYDLTLLLDNGVDLHSYQPTADDIAKIGDSDIFIYVGGESDGWVEDALKEATNKNLKSINLLEILGESAKEEEVVEGMQGDEEEEEAEGEEEIEYDEHVWLSVKNAEIFVDEISAAIQQLDAENKDIYAANEKAYVEKLDELDKQFEQTAKEAKFDTVVFGDRFPFRYLVDDYGIKYYAAFVGCSAETEAGFETVTFLAGKVDELGVPAILVIENSDQKIAQTIMQNTKDKNQEILVMNSLQSVTTSQVNEGFTYLKAMQDNLETLKKALN